MRVVRSLLLAGAAALLAHLALPSQAAAAEPGEAAKAAAKPAAQKAKKSKSAKSRSKARRSKPTKSRRATKRRGARRKSGRRLPKARKPGSKPGAPDQAVRQLVSGDFPKQVQREPFESAELRAMRELDKMLFPPVQAPSAAPWTQRVALPATGPRVDASGLPSAATMKPAAGADAAKDLSWLTKLKKPDLPVRFDPAVVRYLEYYKNSPRGRSLLHALLVKSGRYRGDVRKLLKHYGMPQDVMWLGLIESAFNPKIHSHAGAAGLWQFMPATGRIYGLTVNRRVDERLDPERATHAALKHLKDLYKRFGSWELAFASYNMGYGGLLSSVRKYNTNDYWELRRLEAGLPYETALYVPKIMALAIASHNCDVFQCENLTLDEARPFDRYAERVDVAPGVTLQDVADASGTKLETIRELNAHVVGNHLPPLELSTTPRRSWRVYVPPGKGKKAQKRLPAMGSLRRLGTYRVRWGDSLSVVADLHGTSSNRLLELNDLHPGEQPRPGTLLFVPRGRKARTSDDKPLVIVPPQEFGYRNRKRVFYEAVFGDTVAAVARAARCDETDLRRWNHLDPHAKLQTGMRLQLFLPTWAAPKHVRLLDEGDVELLVAGTPTFYEHIAETRGRKRIEITAEPGDTWRSLGSRYGSSRSWLERINHKNRRSRLSPGDKVVVYARPERVPEPKRASTPKTPPSAPVKDGAAPKKLEVDDKPAPTGATAGKGAAPAAARH
jgi:membrane-bound lytic murein transglycosylase D